MANQGAIPTDYIWRGCASKSSEVPLTSDEDKAAQLAVGTVYYINTKAVNRQFAFRHGKYNIKSKVYRWDKRSVAEIFRKGFLARTQGEANIANYYSLEEYVTQGGFPLVSDRHNSYGFVSTSPNKMWIPVPRSEEEQTVYRYEIYAPAGILVCQFMGHINPYPEQRHFRLSIYGIDSQYIHSAK